MGAGACAFTHGAAIPVSFTQKSGADAALSPDLTDSQLDGPYTAIGSVASGATSFMQTDDRVNPDDNAFTYIGASSGGTTHAGPDGLSFSGSATGSINRQSSARSGNAGAVTAFTYVFTLNEPHAYTLDVKADYLHFGGIFPGPIQGFGLFSFSDPLVVNYAFDAAYDEHFSGVLQPGTHTIGLNISSAAFLASAQPSRQQWSFYMPVTLDLKLTEVDSGPGSAVPEHGASLAFGLLPLGLMLARRNRN